MIFPIPQTKYKIIEAVYRRGEIPISALIREVRASQKRAYAYVQELLTAEVIAEELRGKKPLLRLLRPNLASETGRLCFALLERETLAGFLMKHPRFRGPMEQFRKEAAPLVDAALVFGSLARGTGTKESDLDMLLLMRKMHRKRITAIVETCFVTLENRVSARLLRTKDFIGLLRKGDPFARQAVRDHVVLFHSYRWVRLLSRAAPPPLSSPLSFPAGGMSDTGGHERRR